MDCGPSCLAMIAKHYGKQFDQGILRQICALGKDGVSLLGISKAAETIGFKTKGGRIIRKTKRSEKIKRSVLSRKTKCSFLGSPQYKKTPQISLGRFLFLIILFKHSSQTSHSHHLQAAALFAPNYSRICVRFRDSELCFSVAGLSAAP